MKHSIEILLAVAVAVLSAVLYFQAKGITELRTQIRDLASRPATTLKAQQLDLQEKCAAQAQRAFTNAGYNRGALTFYVNHYNPTLSKCFIEITDTDTKNDPAFIWSSKIVIDAYEGRVYGEYSQTRVKTPYTAKNMSAAGVVECHASLPGENKSCESQKEFESLIKVYME